MLPHWSPGLVHVTMRCSVCICLLCRTEFFPGRPLLLIFGWSEASTASQTAHLWYKRGGVQFFLLLFNPPNPLYHLKAMGPSVTMTPTKPPWITHRCSTFLPRTVNSAFSSRITESDSLRASTVPYPLWTYCGITAQCLACMRSSGNHWVNQCRIL